MYHRPVAAGPYDASAAVYDRPGAVVGSPSVSIIYAEYAPGMDAVPDGTSLVNDAEYDMPSEAASKAPITTSSTIYAEYAPGLDNGAAYGPVHTEDVQCARGNVAGARSCTYTVVSAAGRFCTNHTCGQAGCFNTKSSSDVACDLYGARLVSM